MAGKKRPGKARRLLSFSAMCSEYEPPDWLIPGLLERRQHAVLFGASGVGKSAILIDWMCRLAAGMPLHGVSAAGGEGIGVLYICNEGRGGVTRRIPAWSQAHGFPIHDDVPNLPLAMIDEQLVIDEEGVADLTATMAWFEETFGVPVSLIVVDTLAASFAGTDENSNTEMQRHCSLIAEVAALGPAIIEVHHTGHAEQGRARGASALKGAVDIELRAHMLIDAMKLVMVEATKLKDATGLGRLGYRLVEHDITGDLGDPTGVKAVVALEERLNDDLPPQAMQCWDRLSALYLEQRRNARDEHVTVVVNRDDWLDDVTDQNILTSRNPKQRSKQLTKVVYDLKRAGLVIEQGGGFVPRGIEERL